MNRFLKVIVAGFILLGCSEPNIPADKMVVERVLVIGNSITWHPPNAELGWYGDWGMAASSAENDFLHILRTKFRSRFENVELKGVNVFPFESGFETVSLEDEFEAIKGSSPDILIIRLGENVPLESLEGYNFSIALRDFVNFILEEKSATVIITSTFWESKKIDAQLVHASKEGNWNYIPIGHLGESDANMAIGEFENEFVGLHPNDKGMHEIASIIWSEIEKLIVY